MGTLSNLLLRETTNRGDSYIGIHEFAVKKLFLAGVYKGLDSDRNHLAELLF